jgi:hypothetical protein
MTPLQPVCYRTADDEQPVASFLAALEEAVWPEMDNQILRLTTVEETRPFLDPPHCTAAGYELWELRCEVSADGGTGTYGVLYGVEGIYAVLLHVYPLGKGRPGDAVAIAFGRMEDFRARIRQGGNGSGGVSPLGEPIH